MDKNVLLDSCVGAQWSRFGVHHHHGINVPLSALWSKESCGIGEFYDLVPLIDWCHELGMDVIQLLPLNDTGDDPSPYFAVSALALSPLYLSLHKLHGVDQKELASFSHLNIAKRVSFTEVQSHKLRFLRAYFEKRGADVIKSKAFEAFVDDNDWVETYALFKVLKDQMSKNHWQTWPAEIREYNRQVMDSLIEKHWVEVCFYIFLQFLCFQQLTDVKEYANSKGVSLKGDIPILVSPDSADVWQYADEFDLSFSAGAPPDDYNSEGQVWGLPIFKWEVMRSRHFDWWKERLRYAGNFYELYRIDHVLGFFRIFAIPRGAPSIDGQFIPKDESQWLPQGREILLVLCEHSHMLPVAEDLGVVPESVRHCLSEMGIMGTRVMRWERHKNGKGRFIGIQQYDPISMTTVSTHDSETLTLWWQDLTEEAKEFAETKGWTYTPSLTKAERRDILWDSHHSSSLLHINLLGEYLALFPELVWDDPHDERINIPGTVSPTNWTNRIRPSVEEIVSHGPLRDEMKRILEVDHA